MVRPKANSFVMSLAKNVSNDISTLRMHLKHLHDELKKPDNRMIISAEERGHLRALMLVLFNADQDFHNLITFYEE